MTTERRHRRHPTELKLRLVEAYLNGEGSLKSIAKAHDITHTLLMIWVDKFRRGELTDEIDYVERSREAEAKIAALERKVGQLTMELDVLKKNPPGSRRQQRESVNHLRAAGIPVVEGCRVMNLPRSTFYRAPDVERQQLHEQSDEALRRAIEHVLDDWPAYGYRGVTHELRWSGIVANHKRVARVMRAAQMSAKRPRRFVKTTDSDHADPIYLNLAAGFVPSGPDQLWVAHITYIQLRKRFVYLAAILDAWSRKVVGYALGMTMETTLTLSALDSACNSRRPPPGLIHHSDRGGQCACKAYRDRLALLGIRGSMFRKGNPYDNAKAESFMKTLKHEEVLRVDYEDLQDLQRRGRARAVSTKREGRPTG